MNQYNSWLSPVRSIDLAGIGSKILVSINCVWDKTVISDAINTSSSSFMTSLSTSSFSFPSSSTSSSSLLPPPPSLHTLSDQASKITVHVISESGAYYTGNIDPPFVKAGAYGAFKSSSTRSRLAVAASVLAFNKEAECSVRFLPEDITGQRRLQVLNDEIVVATGSLQRSVISEIETNLSRLLWVSESSCALTTLLKNEAEERAKRAEALLSKLQSENAKLIEGRQNADAEILEGCSKLLNSKKAEISRLKDDVKELTIALAEIKRECKEEREAKELSLARQLILETELSATDEGGGEDDGGTMQDTEGDQQFPLPSPDSEDEERMMNGQSRRREDGFDEEEIKINEEELLDMPSSRDGNIPAVQEREEEVRVPSRKRPAPSLD